MNNKYQKIICAGGYVVNGNKILLIKNKKHNFIGQPKGIIEKDESKLVAAKREIAEETGYFDIELIKKLPPEKYTYQLSGEKPIEKTVFQFLFKLIDARQQKLKLDPDENIEPFWTNLQNAENIVTYKENKKTIKLIKKILSR